MKSGRYRLLITISEFMFSSQLRNICDLVNGLDRNVFDVSIGALRSDDEAVGEIDALGVPYFKFRLIPTRDMEAHDFITALRSPLDLVRGGYDLVHSLLYQSVFSEAWLIKRLTGAKYVYTKSNLEWNNHPAQWKRKSELADAIVSISEATSRLLAEKGFGDRTHKIYLGIDTDFFVADSTKRAERRNEWAIPASALLFGCAAQFIELKEHLTLVRAFETIADRYADVQLIFCGFHHDDDYYKSCISYIEQSRHANRIRVLGKLHDMVGFYSAIDVFALPSRYEAFGYVYVEAMSCARPTVACRAEGPLEIIDEGRTGYFANTSDPADLAIKLEHYVTNRGSIPEHGLKARRRAQTLFSKATMVRQYELLYRHLLGA